MRGFARRETVERTLQWLDQQVSLLESTCVPLAESCGRVLTNDVVSRQDVPTFARSMMDGFALSASDTLGASQYNRLPFAIIGESLPGRSFAGKVASRQAVRIMTGAPLPTGADAVLPVEKVEVEGDRLYAQDQVSPGKHVGRRGEDIATGTIVLRSGRKLRPQDVGVLSSLGIAEVEVVRQPRVRIVVTGNELLPSGSTPVGCQIVDSNGPMLSALIQRDGGVVINPGIVPDDPETIRKALHDDADVIIVSGGSSVGQEDHAPMLLAEHGHLAIHGIAMRPSSPTGMGRLEKRLVFLLPGNPVSCLCAYDFFAGRAIRALGGRDTGWPYRNSVLPLQRKLVSQIGRLDYARVKVTSDTDADDTVEPLAISGASVLTSTTRADGFVVIPADSEGYPAGASVGVYFYD